MKYFPLLAAFALLTAFPVYAEHAETVLQNTPISAKSASTPAGFLGRGQHIFTLNIPALEIDLSPDSNGLIKTGAIYALPQAIKATQLTWEAVNGGFVSRINVLAPQAKRLRLHLQVNQMIPGLNIRLRGKQDRALTVIDNGVFHDQQAWLAVTEGDSVELEIFVASHTPPGAELSIDAVNIIIAEKQENPLLAMTPKKLLLGGSEQPQKDLACWSADPNYPALEKAASATALVHFIHAGSSYVCTGTLLSDKNGSKTPWFSTAQHCLSDQATADTAEFYWFIQAAACNSSQIDNRKAKTSGGAVLLWSDVYHDHAFLRLQQAPPAGVAFMGWDTEMRINSEVWGVHHPKADHTMVSRGRVNSLLNEMTVYMTTIKHLLNIVLFDEGGVEKGSSGSGLFTIKKNTAYWQGNLSLVSLLSYQWAAYSDLNSFYPFIKQWLGEGDYQSSYQQISWVTHSDSDYCLDISDVQGRIYAGYQAIQCGKGFGHFSPADYVRDVLRKPLAKGFIFYWHVWVRNAQGQVSYGGPGYEGQVSAP